MRKSKPKPVAKRQHKSLKAKPKAKPATSARSHKPSAPASISVASPTRYPREIKLDKVIKRRDMGDITGLAKSIDDRCGLISPICIDPQNFLIAGQRRLAAWALSEKFRKEPIPVNVLDVDNILAGEWDENAKRKDFTPEESVELMDALLPKAKEAARLRQAHGKTTKGRRAKDGTAVDANEKGMAEDHLARYLGRDRKTLNRAKEVVDAAKSEPKNEELAKLVTYMNKTGKVNGPFKRLQILRQVAAIKKSPPSMPGKGPYSVASIDFPWPYEDKEQDEIDAAGRSLRPYPAMSIKSICQFAREKVVPLLADDCVVWLHTPNNHLVKGYAHQVMATLGLEGSTMLTWKKDRLGRGQILRDQTEHVIVLIRGKPMINVYGEDPPTTFLDDVRRENSRKPEKFWRLVERVTPAKRYASFFSTGGEGELWDGFGDQNGKHETPVAEPQTPLTELEALETVDNEQSLTGAILAKLKEQKLVRGSVKPRLTKAGIARLGELRRGAPEQPSAVDCRVCGTGNGLCAECLPAEAHVVTMTSDQETGWQVGTCSCGQDYRFPRNEHRNMDEAIKLHWKVVIAAAKKEASASLAEAAE